MFRCNKPGRKMTLKVRGVSAEEALAGSYLANLTFRYQIGKHVAWTIVFLITWCSRPSPSGRKRIKNFDYDGCQDSLSNRLCA